MGHRDWAHVLNLPPAQIWSSAGIQTLESGNSHWLLFPLLLLESVRICYLYKDRKKNGERLVRALWCPIGRFRKELSYNSFHRKAQGGNADDEASVTIRYIDNGKAIFTVILRNKKPNDVHEGKYIGVGGKFEAETPGRMCRAWNLKKQDRRLQRWRWKELSPFQNSTPGHDWKASLFGWRSSVRADWSSPWSGRWMLLFTMKSSVEVSRLGKETIFLEWILERSVLFKWSLIMKHEYVRSIK